MDSASLAQAIRSGIKLPSADKVQPLKYDVSLMNIQEENLYYPPDIQIHFTRPDTGIMENAQDDITIRRFAATVRNITGTHKAGIESQSIAWKIFTLCMNTQYFTT